MNASFSDVRRIQAERKQTKKILRKSTPIQGKSHRFYQEVDPSCAMHRRFQIG
jgi:hypothetical protein